MTNLIGKSENRQIGEIVLNLYLTLNSLIGKSGNWSIGKSINSFDK